MTGVDRLAITHEVVPARLAARSTVQEVSIETLLSSCSRFKVSVKRLVTDAILKVTLVVSGDVDGELNNAASHICGLRFRGLHVLHVSNCGWFGTLLSGVAAKAMRARVVDGGPDPSATGKHCARPTSLHAMWTILVGAPVLQ